MSNNIIDSIKLSGTVYTLSAQTSGGGNPTVELTQAEYDALVTAGTVSADTYYIITDASPADMSQYWTSAQTQSAITQATSGKQETLVSGTNIKTINNQSLLGSGNIDIQGGGGGGKAIEAGRGISITTGETADTVSFNLAISAGTYDSGVIENYSGNRALRYAHAEGYNTSAMTYYCHTEGENTIAKSTGWGAHAEGSNTETSNYYEHASGKFNVSNRASSTWGDSGNTLFSVGNGENNARHNAFEIRQNGDIYLSSGGTDIKLQDHLGGGGKAVTGGTNISVTTGTTVDTINCTLPIREGSNSSGKGIIVGDSECTASGLYGISLGHSSDANGAYSFCNGSNSQANGQMSFAYGDGCDAKNDYTFMFGRSNVSTKEFQFSYGSYVKPKNQLEVGFGTYNNSSSASTTFGHSGNTMFSIGNGYDFSSTHNWHNALEVRQNGDIYVPNTDDTSVTGDYAYSLYPMVRLQDTITATAANTTALGGLKLVKLTQSAYDALSPNYDSNTLYVIVN